MIPEQTGRVTTRRGTVVGRNEKISESKSVPLTDKRTREENFIDRNLRALIERAYEESEGGQTAAVAGLSSATPRGRRRPWRFCQ